MVLAKVHAGSTRQRDGQPPSRWCSSTSPTASGSCGSRSSTSRGASGSCSPGTEAVAVRQARAVPGRRADDQPGRRPDRRQDRPHRAHLPPVREGRPHRRGSIGRLDGRGAAPGRRASPTRCPTGCSTGSTSSTAPRRSATSTRPSRWRHAEAARRRLVFDELLRVQLALVQRKRHLERTTRGIAPRRRRRPLVARFVERLPFALTGAQRRAIGEIERRPRRPAPHAPAAAGRRRRRQDARGRQRAARRGAGRPPGRADGADRGAGRAALPRRPGAARRPHRAATDGGTLVRPTGPLRGRAAHQPHDARPSATHARRRSPPARSTSLIGTHALIQEGVAFRSLGVVVIDEQHRFGVEQRAALREQGGRGAVPDVLVMTATPDPAHRGDDRLRRPRRVGARRAAARAARRSHTAWAQDRRRRGRTVWARVRRRGRRRAPGLRGVPAHRGVREARGALGRGDLRPAAPTGELAGLRLGLLHGRMAPAEKERPWTGSAPGELDVLVATTVIEVGVDVPNATVMVDPRRRPLRHRPAPPAARPGRARGATQS